MVYSLAWGDQPALICEHVDWARACGFKVVCAGKGTRYLPAYHRLTPDDVWDVLEQYLSASLTKAGYAIVSRRDVLNAVAGFGVQLVQALGGQKGGVHRFAPWFVLRCVNT